MRQFRAVIFPFDPGRIAIFGDDDDEPWTVCCTVLIETVSVVHGERSVDGKKALQFVNRFLEKFGHAMTTKFRRHRESFEPLAGGVNILQGVLTIEDLQLSGERVFTRHIRQKAKI